LRSTSPAIAEPSETRITLAHVGKVDPESIDDFIDAGGYHALSKALTMERETIIDELVTASLRGRGGGGFSAGLKERFTRRGAAEAAAIYLVCNADEGEPGTFKDRIIMERDPHLLIEGMIIAGYAIGATRSYIYIRAEYHRSIEMIKKAIAAAQKRGYIGEDILGSGFSLSIELRLGAGSYLCGEELTLIESLEGKRGYPRIKPPFPADSGLYGCPTLVNNVETLATIPAIVEHGAAWYAAFGTEESPGTKIFTISGDVVRPGYYETEVGVTLRELIFGFAGGMRDGKRFKAALIGGAAGTFVDESVLDVPTGYDSLKAVGAVIGSGAIIVLAEGRSIPEMAKSILGFFEHESCGKCVPCRVGMTMLTRSIDNLIAGQAGSVSLHGLVTMAEHMAKTSLCPLGQSPILPLRSLERYFAREFEETRDPD